MQLINIMPNFHMINIGGTVLYFSYETPIAFIKLNGETIIRQNDWSKTTGKHLNHICGNKDVRIPGDKFEQLLNEFLNVKA